MVDDNNMKLGGPYLPIAFNRYSISPPGPAGGIIAVVLANIVAFFLMRMIGKNLES